MNRIVTLVLGKITPSELDLIQGDIIGVDYGAWFCVENHLPMILAVGDFDSISEDQKIELEKWTQVYQLNPIKDESDLEVSLSYTAQYDEVLIVGGVYGRLDHQFVNTRLLKRDMRIKLVNRTNCLRVLPTGSYPINQGHYRYLSVFGFPECQISLQDVQYPLDHKTLAFDEVIGLSNEFLKQEIPLTVHSGFCLLILSQDE